MSPHGGKRKGAGRKAVEKKTTNLCGVRVTPAQLANYKKAAGATDMMLSQWVTCVLDQAAAEWA